MAARGTPPTSLAGLLRDVLGDDLPFGIVLWDGERLGPTDAPATVAVRSPDALTRLVQAPGELGLGRAYVAGDLDVEGDLLAALEAADALPPVHPTLRQWVDAFRLVGPAAARRLPRPPEEMHLRGRRHSPDRDRAAVSHHYDVSNEFYEIVLGPAMTYSCAVWADPAAGLEAAQAAKHELVSRKLGLQPGDRLLDVGCGWGAMVCHAARHHGARAVGVTVAERQAAWAAAAAKAAGLAGPATPGGAPGGRVEIRVQDYRDVDDGPYDAISSIGMFEHVGRERMREYAERLFRLLRPGGRLLNHAISAQPRRPGARTGVPSPVPDALRRRRAGFGRDSFIDRYVFPDGDLLEVGTVVSTLQEVGFEVRHVESLREHYGLTLRAWVANLESQWDAAVGAAGLSRARIWRLYLAASARTFETGRTSVHQVLAVKPDRGRSGFPLRPSFG